MHSSFRLFAATGIHRGDRAYQQDQVALLQHARVHGCVLGVVADGMGGRSGGRKASDQVMLTCHQLFERYDPASDDAAQLLQNMVREAHTVIRLTAISAEQEPHSTMAAFLVLPSGACHWVHSGDSRIYHFEQDKLMYRTRDHSYVQSLVDRGELSEAQAQHHPHANILAGCLGSHTLPPATPHHIERLAPGSTLLACSDGLWHYFDTEELGMLLQALAPRDAAELLVRQARMRAQGRGDNLSLVIVKIEAR
ncbi:protein phosphatase 2C domain-containing protein [Comamonas antarctica]|uniref:PP2C family protein-serine/threonine phosphatase n=1 Tax=Comamonas antarctica TaxID=2743470 RepID=UPI0028E23870|nr:protein phosphatase 2C domain-containing protein [Comamonas antarctica]